MNDSSEVRKVRALFNPRSGLWWSIESVRRALDESWDVPGVDLTYQISKSKEDGIGKAQRAVDDGVDIMIVVGGDGMVNTIGSVLVGTDTALAVIPAGSGNGFARHFAVPLSPEKAARVLSKGHVQKIDVGKIDGRYFFVTCGLAWDAQIIKGFDKSPIRGILPYIFSGIHQYFMYQRQTFKLELDGEKITIEEPLILTSANLTEYGYGAKIAPNARSDDGMLELVMVPIPEPVQFISKLPHLFDGTLDQSDMVQYKRFREMKVEREAAEPVQVDGELLEVPRDFTISIEPLALNVIVPEKEDRVYDAPVLEGERKKG